jgi:hypothetical protein
MADKEVRALLVHPAAWTGIVRFLDQRGIDVDSVGDLEGIPTFSMGIRSLDVPPAPVSAEAPDAPAPSSPAGGGDTATEERELREDEKHHAEFNPKLADGA